MSYAAVSNFMNYVNSANARAMSNSNFFSESTTTTLTSDANYEAIVLETFKSSMTSAAMTGNHEVIAHFLHVGVRFYPHLFFTFQTQEQLEDVISADKKLRDFIYATLTKLKFFLAIENCSIDKLVETIADTGNFSNSYTEAIEDGTEELSEAQMLFDQAYASDKQERLKILYRYEWTIVVFLINMYYVDLCKLLEQILLSYPREENTK